jgi:hypothetical protein
MNLQTSGIHMSKLKDVPQDSTELAASGAEATAAPEAAAMIEAQAGPATESKQPIDAVLVDAPSAEPNIRDTVRSFSLATIKPTAKYSFLLLAASVAIAAALGALIGSLSTLGLTSSKASASDTAAASRGLQVALAQMTKDVAALKTSIDASNRAATTQVSKITERFDRTERAQAEPAAKLAALTDTVAKLEKRLAAGATADDNIVTGSIPQRAATPAAAPKDQTKPPILEGWVLRDYHRGTALVENRSGLYEVRPGANLPGVGRVETITQQNGRWVVVTPKGLIVSMR